MAKIHWTDTMSVGVKSIDEQHKTLIDAINKFYDALDGTASKGTIEELLKKMKDYSIFHFSFEESLLKKHGYQDFNNHQSEHKAFIAKIDDMDKRMKEGKMVLSLELTSFIKSWLTNHIMVNDKRYMGFLNSKGVF